MRVRRRARARNAPKRPDFVLEALPRSPIRKKLRPKPPRAKKPPEPEPDPEPEEEAPQPPQFDPVAAPRAVGTWTQEEDALLSKAVGTIGSRHWRQIAQLVPGRIGKQCRERWHQHVRPGIKKCTEWMREEDLALHLGVNKLGHQWSAIARSLPGRTDNQVKNRYNVLRNNARAHGAAKVASAAYPDDPFLRQLAQANLEADACRRPPGWTADGHRRSKNLKQTAVRVLHKLAGSRNRGGNRGGKQRVWTHEEHARLVVAVPAYSVNDAALNFSQYGRGVCAVDWRQVAAVVGTRSVAGCKEYWRARQRSPREYPAPPPAVKEPKELAHEEEEEDAQMESLGSMDPQDLVSEYTDDPDLKLMAIETLDERPHPPSWTKSCAMVIGRRGDLGLSFRFPPLGRSLPSPPPVRATVLAASTETARAWQWVREKERLEAERLGAWSMPKKTKKKKTKADLLDFAPLAALLAPPAPPPPPALVTELTDFFQERKRRQAAEELAKSVFA